LLDLFENVTVVHLLQRLIAASAIGNINSALVVRLYKKNEGAFQKTSFLVVRRSLLQWVPLPYRRFLTAAI